MHKNAMKCNKTQSKWYINKHRASKIIDMFEMYHGHLATSSIFSGAVAEEKEDFCKGSLACSIFYFVIVLLYFIFACIFLSKTHKN
jgi:hypothetical protein